MTDKHNRRRDDNAATDLRTVVHELRRCARTGMTAEQVCDLLRRIGVTPPEADPQGGGGPGEPEDR